MALRGHVFDKQLFSSDCYALITDTVLNKKSGIIKGCELTNTASSIYIADGYFVVKGRLIEEEGGTTIGIEPGTSEGIYCKLICEIDMSQTNTTTMLNQASYKVLEDVTDFPELIQEDITDGGTIYQFELAKFKKTLNGIENFVDTRIFLNCNSTYEELKNEINQIKGGSLFITEEQFKKGIADIGIVVSATEPTEDNRKKVWIQKNKNLIKTFYKNNYYNANDNKFLWHNEMARTEYIPIELNTNYIFSDSLGVTMDGQIHLFDSNYNHIEYIWVPSVADVINIKNENAKYMVLNIFDTNITNETWMQLEKGTVVTEYEPYIEEEAMYIKDANGMYEKFISIEKS